MCFGRKNKNNMAKFNNLNTTETLVILSREETVDLIIKLIALLSDVSVPGFQAGACPEISSYVDQHKYIFCIEKSK
jgi:hypothetical protein